MTPPKHSTSTSSITIARVLAIPYVVDGDTAWVQLEFTVGTTIDGRELIERDYLGGSKVRLARPDMSLNAPELRKAGGAEARTAFLGWCESALSSTVTPVTAEIIKKDSFGRYLADLRCGEASAVRWMRGQGYPEYKS